MLLDLLRCWPPPAVLVCPVDGPLVDAVRRDTPHRVRVIRRPRRDDAAMSKILLRLRYIVELHRTFRAEKASAVYISTAAHTSPLIAARLAGVPALLSVMESATFFRGDWRVKARLLVLRTMPARMIAVSRATAGLLASVGIAPERVEVVHCGIRPESYDVGDDRRTLVRDRYGVRPDEVLIGMTGQIQPRKDTETFVKAAAITRQRLGDRARFVVIGGVSDPAYFRAVADLVEREGLGSALTFAGYQADIVGWLQAMDIFVSCSLEEPFARAILEAMASALPVVATRVDGTGEAVLDNKTGFLFPPRNAVALADRLVELGDDANLRTRLGSAGRKVVRERFTLSGFCDRISEIVHAAAESERPSRDPAQMHGG